MKATKQKKLQDAGWTVGSTSDFLELTKAEETIVAMKLALASNLRALRQERSDNASTDRALTPALTLLLHVGGVLFVWKLFKQLAQCGLGNASIRRRRIWAWGKTVIVNHFSIRVNDHLAYRKNTKSWSNHPSWLGG